jgi:predicted transcriptional regulator YdeE
MDDFNLKIKNVESFKVVGISADCLCDLNNNVFEDTCGRIWRKFIFEKIADKISNKENKKLYAVYFDYDEKTKTYNRYLVGCKVYPEAPIPQGMESITVTGGTYLKISTIEKVPECHSGPWEDIGESNLNRTFKTDFEVYDKSIKHWRSAELDIFIGIDLNGSEKHEENGR